MLVCLPVSVVSATASGSSVTSGTGTNPAVYGTTCCCTISAERRAIRLAGRYGPETYAARKRSIVVVSTFRYPCPGACGSSYASATPRTIRLSTAENVRRPIRYDRYVSRPRSLPSSRRCEASSRCTPMDRPIRPICRNRSMKSGLAVSSSENSSQMISRLGSGASAAPPVRACS